MGEVIASSADVARLFGRAAFGARSEDLDLYAGVPYAEVVETLLAVPAPPLRTEPDEVDRQLLVAGLGADTTRRRQWELLSERWWLDHMKTTRYPLLDRMVLFWHDHFATAFAGPYPDPAMMLVQNQTLRDHALGNFRAMCEAVTLDPAMLFWLNGNENRKGRPNENYAREFFELFTLGTVPQIYTEDDVRESARALTGWTVDPATRMVSFAAARHDTGTKTVLGRTITNAGDQEYKQIVDVALAHDVSPLFLAYKLVLGFGYVPQTANVLSDPDPLIATVASVLRATGWDLTAAMRATLNADEWRYANAADSKQIVRQPIDLVVSLGRQLGFSLDGNEVTNVLVDMGQEPFNPPNVGGWPNGREWLSPATTLARYNWGITAYNLAKAAPVSLLRSMPASNDVDAWRALFGLAALAANTRSALTDYLASRGGAPEAEKQAGVLILLASSPDWMVM